MALAVNSTSSGTATGASSLTYALNNVAGNVLIVDAGLNSDARTVTGVTYGGVAMSKVVEKVSTAANADCYVSIWSLANPATGSNNVVVTASASGNINSGAVSFTGGNTAFPTGATNTKDQASGTTNSIALTTNFANSIIIDAWIFAGTVTSLSATGSNQTLRWNNDTSRTGAGSTETTTSATSYTLSWSWTGSVASAGCCAEVRAASAVNSNFLAFM